MQRLDSIRGAHRHWGDTRAPHFTRRLSYEYPAGTPDKLTRLASNVLVEFASDQTRLASIAFETAEGDAVAAPPVASFTRARP